MASDVAEIVEAEGLVDGEVAEGGSDVLRALFGTDSALVSEYAFITRESDDIDDSGVLGCADFDDVVPTVSGVTVEWVVPSLPRLFSRFYEHLVSAWPWFFHSPPLIPPHGGRVGLADFQYCLVGSTSILWFLRRTEIAKWGRFVALKEQVGVEEAREVEGV